MQPFGVIRFVSQFDDVPAVGTSRMRVSVGMTVSIVCCTVTRGWRQIDICRSIAADHDKPA